MGFIGKSYGVTAQRDLASNILQYFGWLQSLETAKIMEAYIGICSKHLVLPFNECQIMEKYLTDNLVGRSQWGGASGKK